ncbi:MAG TPA: hypothetical protein PLS59_04845 [Kiritimatiellia bacterium]|nr:hypothetical protein [Kiritimatiellia bacterium]
MIRRLLVLLCLAVVVLALWPVAIHLRDNQPVVLLPGTEEELRERAAAQAATIEQSDADFDQSIPEAALEPQVVMDADETPWPADTATDSIPFAALHKALAAAMAENELAGVQQLLDSLATPAERRGAFRWLAHHDGDAGLAMALTILWMTPADDPRHADYISALHGIRHPALAAWLVQALATTTDEQTRERLAAVLATVRGPALIEAIEQQLATNYSPTQRAPWLAVLRQRTDFEELPALMSLAESSDPDIAAAAAHGIANIGGWEACLWLAECALQPNAPHYYRDALAAGSSGFSQAAMAFIAGGRGVPEPLRTAAVAGGTAAGAGQLHPAVQSGQDGMDDSERWF